MSIVFGLLTAMFFAAGTLASSRLVRMIGPLSAISGMMLVGLVIITPMIFISGVPEKLNATNAIWLIVGGLGNLCGLLLAYTALRIGKVGVVAPILCTEGAIAATISGLAGESIAPIVIFLLLVIVGGVVLTAIAPDPVPIENEQPLKAALIATTGAVIFGIGLFATGNISGELPLEWILLPARIVTLICIAIPLLVLRKFRMTRPAAPLILLAGVAEIFGYAAYTTGAAKSVAITAVLASLFAPISAVAAYLLFRERLGRQQVVAVVIIVTGVVTLTLVS
ncbi:MAG: EamA family transporter [Actinobacteria bacterium]|nr:EamA family transporter [Actinomycetota bacterium]